jgi:predicted nucleic acid-binding protein
MIVVADSSPLIAMGRIGQLEILHAVFGQLLVPDAVWRVL